MSRRTTKIVAFAILNALAGFAQVAGDGIQVTLASLDNTFQRRRGLAAMEPDTKPKLEADIRQILAGVFSYWSFEPKQAAVQCTVKFVRTYDTGSALVTLSFEPSPAFPYVDPNKLWTGKFVPPLPNDHSYAAWMPMAKAIRDLVLNETNRAEILKVLQWVPIASQAVPQQGTPPERDSDRIGVHAHVVPFRQPPPGTDTKYDCFIMEGVAARPAGGSPRSVAAESRYHSQGTGPYMGTALELELYKRSQCGQAPFQSDEWLQGIVIKRVRWALSAGPLQPRTHEFQ